MSESWVEKPSVGGLICQKEFFLLYSMVSVERPNLSEFMTGKCAYVIPENISQMWSIKAGNPPSSHTGNRPGNGRYKPVLVAIGWQEKVLICASQSAANYLTEINENGWEWRFWFVINFSSMPHLGQKWQKSSIALFLCFFTVMGIGFPDSQMT